MTTEAGEARLGPSGVPPSKTLTLTTTRFDTIARNLNPLGLVRNIWRNRDLILQFTRRDVEGRYRGSFLGLVWSFANPLIILGVYTLVFGTIFRGRWRQSQSDGLGEFALALFCGLVVTNAFGECASRATGLIVSVPNYVKKVVFPLEVLPVSALGAALFHALVSLTVLVLTNLVLTRAVHATLLLLPLVLMPLIFLILGTTWFLASLGVFVRDTHYAVVMFTQVLPFVTPVFYPISAVPEPFRTFIAVNPLTPVVENLRAIVLWGLLPNFRDIALSCLVTGLLMLCGYAWFMKTKKAFADVL
jgi:lipopolysaccharide transport system permease protein